MNKKLSENMRDHLYAIDAGLLEDPLGQSLDLVYRCGVTDDFTRDLLKGRIHNHVLEMEKHGPFHRPRKLTQGDFYQGFDIKGQEIRFPVDWLNEPKLTIGTTGSGKTTLARYEILMLAPFFSLGKLSAWLFDFRKTEFGALQPYLARLEKHLNIITGRKMKLNPLQVPCSVEPISYASNLSDALVRVWEVPPVASLLLSQSIIQLYRTFGVLDGGQHYPTMFDLHSVIRKNTGSNSQARNAVLVRLETLLISVGNVLAYRKGWDVHELSKLSINFQFNDITEKDQNLFLSVLLLHAFMSRVAQSRSNAKMNLLIYCDEASRLVNSSDTSVSQFIGLIRGTGIGLNLSNQTADISRSILSNTPNKILGRCASATDYDVMGASMGLTAEQKQWLKIHLKKPGMFLASLGQAVHPFLFTVPNLNFKQSDFTVDRSFPELDRLPIVPAPEFSNWTTFAQPEVVVETTSSPLERQSEGTDATQLTLSPDEIRYLKEVVKTPKKPISYYPPRIQMGTGHALKIRKALISKGFIKLEKVQQSPGRGRPSNIVVPTSLAHDAVSALQGEC
ncbi:AAA-like domain protein [Gimesia alba]|uniref:AAA-like domain protein n=1 Tax=Gimesia alba TaxID=2527973 RepID=A0A517RFB2_9PLAN|nr:hypothetical protein [Gimesia alba]QDT42563.1 AAA-like domain protein [Gimesia alba]